MSFGGRPFGKANMQLERGKKWGGGTGRGVQLGVGKKKKYEK